MDVESIKIPEGAYVVLVTRGVNDAPLLKYLSKFNLNYVGLVASQNRWEATRDELQKLGVPREFIERVRAPAGIDINSILLEEIAISILAEIIEVRRKPLFDEASEMQQTAAAGREKKTSNVAATNDIRK